jgi:perosamine synthetase
MKLFQTKISPQDIQDKISPVLERGELGFGENVSKVEEVFSSFSNQKYNIATNSASASAFMIFSYLKEKYGKCDIYTPSLAFTSPAWAAKHFGHNIIWVEVNENLLFDVEDYKKQRNIRCERYSDGAIQPVLMPVLYGGVSNIKGFDTIKEDGYNEIAVIDAAHCVTPTIKSDFTFFSFHPYKPIAASDGGMISTDIEEADEYFRSYRNFGRKNIDGGYDIVMNGFKFYMNNLNATIALTQIERYQENLETRKKNHIFRQNIDLGGRLISHDKHSSYYFDTLVGNEDNIEELNKKYPTSKHYPLLHKTKYFSDGSSLPFTEKIHKYIINLPLYENIHNS